MQEQFFIPLDLVILGLFILIIFLFLKPKLTPKKKSGFEFILNADLNKLMKQDEDILVIDIRRIEEYNGYSGYIKESLNIPLASLIEKLQENAEVLQNLKDLPVVVVGFKNDSDIVTAALLLQTNGFTDIKLLKNGISGWMKSKLPLEKNEAGA